MIKPGDTVRYLNAVGGGKVVRVEGSIAYVDDDGFETPVRTSELVVVMPAGHKSDTPGRKMFDQQAFDAGRSDSRPESVSCSRPDSGPEQSSVSRPVEDFPIEETEYGDDMTIVLAFEPKDVKRLAETQIQLLLVNDSNYFLNWQILCREGETDWKLEAAGEAAPNELVELGEYTQESVRRFERFVFQSIASKHDRPFEVKAPVGVSRKVDITKFFKMHCFRPTVYFDTPVLEVPIMAEVPRNNKK